eukprot:CAMPEP_0116559546 /NCGR_PEP_ID=MMETSP0397-20121206/10460_1 /TAXON_ID=216820 /ORGANISM="Cyclophora tenuis, Strain ECT3854" /LENGTH=448 /DNA_ID=CAMNT_0004085335 /DNA_START=325 /DNA_END=1671 /DNA_ORIENTATION=-
MTTACALLTIVLIALLIRLLHQRATPMYAAVAIAFANNIFPKLAKLLTAFEKHSTESHRQTSLYFKIAGFRWANTAVVITAITPFTNTVTNKGLLESVFSIFVADLVVSHSLQLLDVVGQIKRHYLAPRAPNQDMMNLHMSGSRFELAERYTNMTKTLFLALWYSALFPGALFLCAVTLVVTYNADRFSLMRTWSRQPLLGTSLAKFSRRYFFSSALVAMAVVSAYTWAGFPFDNICKTGTKVDKAFVGTFKLDVKDGTKGTTSVQQEDFEYNYCLQALLQPPNVKFPPVPDKQPSSLKWMTPDQEMLSRVYGWTSVVAVGLFVWVILYTIVKTIENIFRRSYKPQGKDQMVPFSKIPSASTYIPQVQSGLYSYPLLACSCTGLDPDIFDWQDPDRPHKYYDLTLDAMDIIEGCDDGTKRVFSIVSHRQPPARKGDYQVEDDTSYIHI